MDPPTEVVDGIYIGSLNSTRGELLDRAGIDAIINLSGQCYESNRAVINIIMEDINVTLDTVDAYMKKFTIGVAAIEVALKEKKKVLVHCAAGINRSATLIAFYMIENGYSYESTFASLSAANKKRGVELLTNQSFRSILKTYYVQKKNFAERNKYFNDLQKKA